jgi:hypothetical protein
LLLYSSHLALGVFQLAGHFYFINSAHQVFLAPLPGNEEVEEEESPTSTRRQQNINKFFWRRCRGGRRLLRGEFSHAHPLLCLLFCFTLFLLASFYQKPKKIRILCSCFYLSTFSLLESLLLKIPSYVTLLARIIVILSALLLRHLLLLQIFMRLSLLC